MSDEDFGSFVFADLDPSYTQQPPATVGEIYALLADVEKSKRRILVHPARVAEFEEAVRRAGLWAFVRVEAHALLDAGQVVFAQSQAGFEADARSVMNRAVTESFETLRKQTEAAPDIVRAYLDEQAREELVHDLVHRKYETPRRFPMIGPSGV